MSSEQCTVCGIVTAKPRKAANGKNCQEANTSPAFQDAVCADKDSFEAGGGAEGGAGDGAWDDAWDDAGDDAWDGAWDNAWDDAGGETEVAWGGCGAVCAVFRTCVYV